MLGTVVAIFICAVGAEGVKTRWNQPPGEASVDTIVIDTLARFGLKDKPPVPFRHDFHTEVLEKQQKDCFACHIKESLPPFASADQGPQTNERMSIKFMRLKDTNAKEVRKIYHENCIGCHMTMAEKGGEFGPVVCGECHRELTVKSPARKPVGMDKSLHFRHAKAAKDNCETCHHSGDKGTCRYCHKDKVEDDTISMPMASHLSCVECHRDAIEKKLKGGPVTCYGCHDAKAQEKIKKVEPLPRLEGGQPDTVFVKAARKGQQGEIARMNPVPFDHRGHEAYNDTCRVCHHASLTACSECHALGNPLKEGNYVQLERAMHQRDSEKSCAGCHRLQQRSKECAGCHVFVSQGREGQSESCLKCHMKPLPDSASVPSTAEAQAELAKRLLQSRVPVKGTCPAEEIPDKVIIKTLVDKYEPVNLPHRKIVLSLVEKMDKSKQAGKLASHFHDDKTTICQGCHHNSPASVKPPACLTCHSKPFDEGNLAKPGIIGAYHQQCMGCHEAMEIRNPRECVDCHKERKN